MQKKSNAPIYIEKIDWIFDFLKREATIKAQPYMRFFPYALYLLAVMSVLALFEIRDISAKVDENTKRLEYSISVFEMYRDNINIVSDTVCFKCHSSPSTIMSKMVMHYDNVDTFIKYVRVGGKSKAGVTMPAIKEKECSNEKLREIFEKAKKW